MHKSVIYYLYTFKSSKQRDIKDFVILPIEKYWLMAQKSKCQLHALTLADIIKRLHKA